MSGVVAIEVGVPGPPGEGMDPGQVAEIEAAIARGIPDTTGLDGQIPTIGPDGPTWIDTTEYTVKHPRFAGGAKGDNSTDDTAAIAAVNATIGSKGGEIVFPEGTYVVSARFLPNTNTKWRGTYGKSVLKYKDGVTAFNLFQVGGGASGVVFEDLVIDANKANTTDAGSDTTGIPIYFAQTSGGNTGGAVRRVIVKNAHRHGIRALGSGSTADTYSKPTNRIDIERCEVFGCGHIGIWAHSLTEVSIATNRTYDNGRSGIQVENCRAPHVSGNWSWENDVHGIVVTYCVDFDVSSNKVWSNWHWGIAIGGGVAAYTPNTGFVIASNIARANGASGNFGGNITFDPTIAGAGLAAVDQFGTVTGNVTRDSVWGHGLYVQNGAYMSITGNLSDGNEDCGFLINGRMLTISGNVATNNDNYGYYFSGATSGGTPDRGHIRFDPGIVSGNGIGDVYWDPLLVNVLEASYAVPDDLGV